MYKCTNVQMYKCKKCINVKNVQIYINKYDRINMKYFYVLI